VKLFRMSNLRILKAVPLDIYNSLIANQQPQAETNSYTFKCPTQLVEACDMNQFGGGVSKEFDPMSFSPLLQLIPLQQRKKSRQLLELISKSKNISWNELGEILVNGALIHKSNIVDLVAVATKNGKLRKSQISLPGLNQLIAFIREANIPNSLLGSEFIRILEEKKTRCGWVDYEFTNLIK
jgi:hypothetical protein